jgi:hypothetical protein
VCNNSLSCAQNGSNHNEYALEGPLYFYSNKDFGLRCLGFQPGVNANCSVVAKETCGDTPEGGPPRFQYDADNCFGRATRNRTWDAGPNFINGPGVTTSGNTKRFPPWTWVYRDDQFKNPGGKQVVVDAMLETAGQANVRVQLKNGFDLVYDFGTLSLTSTTVATKKFTSTIVVNAPVTTVVVSNEGPGVVIVNTVKVQD